MKYGRDFYIKVFKKCDFYGNFVKAMENPSVNKFKEKDIEKFFKVSDDIYRWIDDAFRWSDTPEKHEWWEDRQSVWSDFVMGDKWDGLARYYEGDLGKVFRTGCVDDDCSGTSDDREFAFNPQHIIPQCVDDFREILRHCSFYEELKGEWEEQNEGYEFEDMLKEIPYDEIYGWLGRDISWDNTENGYGYWDNIDDDWRAFIDACNNGDYSFSQISRYYSADTFSGGGICGSFSIRMKKHKVSLDFNL